MLTSLSSKALLEQAREGNRAAASALCERWGVKVRDFDRAIEGFKALKVVSMTAAKRIAVANS